MNHEGSTLLASSGCGHIKMCMPGCVHFTFGQVTLHFLTTEEFEAMAHSVVIEAEARRFDETFDIQHAWFSMSLTLLGSREFAALASEALATLAWDRGEFEFTDEDLYQIRMAG